MDSTGPFYDGHIILCFLLLAVLSISSSLSSSCLLPPLLLIQGLLKSTSVSTTLIHIPVLVPILEIKTNTGLIKKILFPQLFITHNKAKTTFCTRLYPLRWSHFIITYSGKDDLLYKIAYFNMYSTVLCYCQFTPF